MDRYDVVYAAVHGCEFVPTPSPVVAMHGAVHQFWPVEEIIEHVERVIVGSTAVT